jgi:hypothetical protein
MIEESVLEQLRVAFANHENRDHFGVTDADMEAFEHDPAALLQALVKRVSFHGNTGAVHLDLRTKEVVHED